MTNLTEAQRAVVESTAANILVVAGPGSGKTHTMVERISRILRDGTPAGKLVVITFTNAGAKELQKRLAGDGEAPRFGYLGTLHGFALRMLQHHGRLLGYRQSITVLDEEQAEEFLDDVAKATGYKGTKKGLQMAMEKVRTCLRPRLPAEITAAQYLRELRTASAVDFNTILADFLELLNHPEARLPRWEHLIVDEYQDSGPVDAEIYRAMQVANRCFVGDPDQAIYGFRGATVGNILDLACSTGVELHNLSANFRCAAAICTAANRLIEHNRNRLAKRTLSNDYERVGNVIVASAMGLDDEERSAVLNNARKLINDGTSPSEIAVLCRYNATATDYARAAQAMGLPVRKKNGGTLPKPEWALARAGVELLNAPESTLAARNFCRLKYGIEECRALLHRAALAMRPLHTIMPEKLPPPGATVSPADLPNWLARFGVTRQAIELVQAKTAEIPEPDLATISFALARDVEHQSEQGEGITITTIHGAKGREWDTVYMVAVEQEIMPGTGKARDVEEERRIAFVGITRAKTRLLLSAASQRRETWGNNRHAPSTPSQFLREVGPQ